MSNHYRTLGVAADADEAAIRHAYLRLMRVHHPDRNSGEASNRAQEITGAYRVLSDSDRRRAYDQTLAEHLWVERPVGPVRSRVRGGAWTRKFALLAVAGTAGLIVFAMRQPVPLPATAHAPKPRAVVAEAPVRPPLPTPTIESKAPPAAMPVDEPVEGSVLPPLPVAVDLPEPLPAPRRAVGRPSPVVTASVPAATSATSDIDLVGLERHLKLLTSQSLRHADARRRGLLASSADTFASTLAACPTDACKRDAYLRRNQEIFEIMGS